MAKLAEYETLPGFTVENVCATMDAGSDIHLFTQVWLAFLHFSILTKTFLGRALATIINVY